MVRHTFGKGLISQNNQFKSPWATKFSQFLTRQTLTIFHFSNFVLFFLLCMNLFCFSWDNHLERKTRQIRQLCLFEADVFFSQICARFLFWLRWRFSLLNECTLNLILSSCPLKGFKRAKSTLSFT